MTTTLLRVEEIRAKGAEFLALLGDELRDASHADSAAFASLMLANSAILLDAADAFAELHDRLCGCDSPGQVSLCAWDEFRALVPLLEPQP